MTSPKGPVDDLDLTEVGRLLIVAAAVSQHLGHAWVSGTARDYLQGWDDTPESRFVRNVLANNNQEIFDAWFQDKWVVAAHVFKGAGI